MNQIPRQALIQLLTGIFATLLIHYSHLPMLFWGLALVVIGWRWLMHLGRFSYPGKWTKVVAVLTGSAAVAASYSGQFSLESAVAFFVMAALLKLLEMKERRDGYILVFLQYFLLAGGFLFEQGLLWGLFGILMLGQITATLVSLQAGGNSAPGLLTGYRYAGMLMLTALPLMLLFYLLFPRLGPLWSIALQSDKALTGLRGDMAPGDIADLSRSDELAFRVAFEQDRLPPRNKLYWRAMVLDRYDGRTWSFSPQDRSVRWYPDSQVRTSVANVRYEIIQEPTGEHWLFSLRNGTAIEPDIGATSTGVLVSRKPVFQRRRYQVVSQADAVAFQSLSAYERSLNTRLPDGINPRARELALAFRQQAEEAGRFSMAIANFFNEQPFHYTLQPPALGRNDIDAFLFETRRGFCAHYAGAFVFMARAAGFPARVVTGYQGGEWNADEHFLTVRQYDAHAWAEIWQDGIGWIRVDPTAAVAPNRIELGLEAALRGEEAELLQGSLLTTAVRNSSWLNAVRQRMESLNFAWNRWVLSYDNQRQKSLLQSWFNRNDYNSMLTWLGAGFVGLFALTGLMLLLRRPATPTPPLIREWQAFERKAVALGYPPPGGQTPLQWLQQLAQLAPSTAPELQALGRHLQAHLYRPDHAEGSERILLTALRRLRRRLRPAAKTAGTGHVQERTV